MSEDFKPPRTALGRRLRRDARISASVIDVYEENLRNESVSPKQNALSTLSRLRSKTQYLREFTIKDVADMIRKYGDVRHSSGSRGEPLVALSALLGVDLGELLNTNGDESAILSLIKRRR